jgi:hypothetical protein
MDINTFLDIFNAHPSWYFIAGFVAGYLLHGFIMQAFASAFRSKKPNRYQSNKSDAPLKRSTAAGEVHEPSFDLPEAVANSLTPRRLSGISFDQHGNEV